MGISKDEFSKLLQQKFPEANCKLNALVDDGEHYELEIISPRFAGLSLLAQHRLVYEELGIMKEKLHALQLKTKAS